MQISFGGLRGLLEKVWKQTPSRRPRHTSDMQGRKYVYSDSLGKESINQTSSEQTRADSGEAAEIHRSGGGIGKQDIY